MGKVSEKGDAPRRRELPPLLELKDLVRAKGKKRTKKQQLNNCECDYS